MTHTLTRPPVDDLTPAGPDTPARPSRFTRDRILLASLLAGTAVLYIVGLSRSGWANQFYAAAAQAGSKSWKAFLFGSLDASNFITVDKPPASLWVIDLSMRIFGVNSWSLLVPQALEGVAAVALLYAAVKRVSGPTAGLLAGTALATTPVAALMFRFDNPDALLVLLMTAAAYATVRATEKASPRWLMLVGVLLGFAFLTKMLQGLLVLPAFAIAYLVAAPTSVRKRILHTLGAGLAMLVAAGWWIALVELWPSGSRPYIGGSTNNNILELVLGYNGIGRLTGGDNNGNTSGGTGGFSSGDTGILRLFGTDMGSQISWLLPAALIGLVALAVLTFRRARTDALRASTIVWGGWLIVTGIVFSFASGIIHPYYTVALAPAIAALVGISVVELWRRRDGLPARWTLAALVAAGTLWSFTLQGRADWHPELRWIVLVSGSIAVALIVYARVRAAIVAPVLALALLLGPTAYSIETAATAHTGSLPTAGPSSTSAFGPGGGGMPGGTTGGFPGGTTGGFPGSTSTGGSSTGGSSTGGSTSGGSTSGGSTSGGSTSGGLPGGSSSGGFPGGSTSGGSSTRGSSTGGMTSPGGLGGAADVSSALQKALEANASDYTWVAATTSSNEASSLELSTGDSVMSLGGFNGTDPAISLSAFKALVAEGKVHYYVADGQGFIGSTAANTSTAYQIEKWVENNFTARTIGGTTVYDLTTGS